MTSFIFILEEELDHLRSYFQSNRYNACEIDGLVKSKNSPKRNMDEQIVRANACKFISQVTVRIEKVLNKPNIKTDLQAT